MTAALSDNGLFQVVAGLEIEPDYADEWQAKHSDAVLIQADVRSLHSTEFPSFDVLLAGIPCTSHSNLGRAKKRLARKPELGDTGDLFLPVVSLVADQMPAALVLENVPSFATSLAGELLVASLKRLGYHVFTTILEPNKEWAEIEDRRRWLLIGTLAKPVMLTVPDKECRTPLHSFLDVADAKRDCEDAARIAQTIEGLRSHNKRHRELGHGFGFTVVNGTETRLPTIPKSYHKINTGPFVETPFGLRLLRQGEIERIHGCALRTKNYALAVQMLGQGVQTPVFRQIFEQLGAHLSPSAEHADA